MIWATPTLAFGGEIKTQNLDTLAPKDVHQVGLGTMAKMLSVAPDLARQPGYEGHLHAHFTTLADRLGAAGYHTMMTGKLPLIPCA